jgi:DNA-binding beta-propeller fold protein YncE
MSFLTLIPLALAAPQVTGTLVVTNKTPSTATVIDVASGRTLATIPTGPGPHEVVLSSDGRTAVVTDYSGPVGTRKTLTVIDVPALKVTRTIDLGDYRSPHGIVFLPGDSIVAVTSEASRNVVLVHVVEGVVRRAISTNAAGSHMVAVTADGSRGFTGDMGAHTVSILDLRAGTLLQAFPVPNTPEAINVTPDGSEVWVGSNATGRVSVLDPRTGTVTTAAEGVSWPYRILFTPDVRTVVIPDMRNHEVRFLDRVSRRELSRLSLPDAGPQGITVTPDGKFAFLSLSQQARVAVIDLATRQIVRHIEAGNTPDGIAYTTRVIAQ